MVLRGRGQDDGSKVRREPATRRDPRSDLTPPVDDVGVLIRPTDGNDRDGRGVRGPSPERVAARWPNRVDQAS